MPLYMTRFCGVGVAIVIDGFDNCKTFSGVFVIVMVTHDIMSRKLFWERRCLTWVHLIQISQR
jgi:hypothetical protein